MTHAPDEIQYGYARLVEVVFIYMRNGNITDGEQLSDLAHAMHNVGAVLTDYGRWVDDQRYRAMFLRAYDKKWGKSGFNLETNLDDAIASYKRRNP